MAGIRVTLKSTGQQMVAKLEIEDCFICDDPHIFIKALIKIAYNVGQQRAKQKIDEQLKGFSSENPLRIYDTVKKNEEIPITGKFPKYKEPKGFYNSVLRVMGGLNVVDYTSNMELYGQNIPYDGKVYIQKEENFHIYGVSITTNEKASFGKDIRNVITFYNKENRIVARLFFKSEKDLLLIWDTYYTKMSTFYEKSYFIQYDKEHRTNYYKMFKDFL